MDTQKYRLVASREEVDDIIARIAKEILSDYNGEHPLFVALLRGANPFTSKLMYQIARLSPEFHPDIDYMTVSTYGDSHEARTPKIITDLSPTTELSGRDVIIIDDVLDLGITADFVRDHLLTCGAKNVKLAVLANKSVSRIKSVHADYSGITANDAWLVGMGMDDAKSGREHYRWLDEIWEIIR